MTWPYAWVLSTIVAVAALSVHLFAQGFIYTGALLIGFASLTLLIVFTKEKFERSEREYAYYSVDGDKVTLQLTYSDFEKLPFKVKDELMEDRRVERWQKLEGTRHGIEFLKEHQSRAGRVRYRLRRWFFAFFG